MILAVVRLVVVLLAAAGLASAQAPPRARYLDACRNEARIEALGTQPLATHLQTVAGARSPRQLGELIGALQRVGAFAAFRLGDESVPQRDRDPRTQQYAERLFALVGDPAPAAAEEARAALNFEVALLPTGPNTEEPLDRAQLRKLAPSFDWDGYWNALGAPAQARLRIAPASVRALRGRLIAASIPEWTSYLRWCWLRATAALLGTAFVEAHYQFTEGRRPPARAALCEAAAAAFPAAAYAQVPLARGEYFEDTLHLRAWRARQQWSRRRVVNSTSARQTPSGGR